jgi:hypothetical protein
MSEPKLVRPPRVMVAGWLVVAGSVVVVLMALDQVAKLHSLDTREAVDEYLSKPPGDELGLGVQDALTALRVVLTVTGVAAAVTAVLGWYALQRSKGARLALSVLAVPLFLSGFVFGSFVGGGVLPAMVTAAILMLWLQPARDWFDGVTRAPVPSPPPSTPGPTGRDPLLDLPPPTAPPLHPTPYAGSPLHPGSTARRPTSVTWACVIAWLSTAAVVGMLALVLVVMLAAPDALLDAAHRENPDLSTKGISDADLKTTTYVACGVVMAWSAAAAALALLTWRRVRWAAKGLAVSAGLASLLCLLSVVAALAVPLLVPMAVCTATVALLLRRESLAWLRR